LPVLPQASAASDSAPTEATRRRRRSKASFLTHRLRQGPCREQAIHRTHRALAGSGAGRGVQAEAGFEHRKRRVNDHAGTAIDDLLSSCQAPIGRSFEYHRCGKRLCTRLLPRDGARRLSARGGSRSESLAITARNPAARWSQTFRTRGAWRTYLLKPRS